jgi:competence protein ComEC
VPLKVHFLNVGRGDCTIIEFPSGRVGMVDIDHLKVLDEDTRLELSQEAGISLKTAEEKLTDPLDYYDAQIGPTTDIFRFIATYPDMDHLTGLYRLHKQEYDKAIVNFWHPTYENFNLGGKIDWDDSPYDERDWETYKALRGSLESPKSLKQSKGDTGNYWTEDGVEIWAPTPELEDIASEQDKPNIVSLILKLSYQGRSIVLGGDATADETWTKIWLSTNMKDVDVLKASHHGRKSGYHGLSVKEMSPWLTITSVANDSEHDATQNYRRYSKHTVSLRKSGDIRITIHDDGSLTYSPNIEAHWKPRIT